MLVIRGLLLSLFGFWSRWLGTEGNNDPMSGQFWYVFEASPVYVIGGVAVLILVLAAGSYWSDAGALPHLIGLLAIFLVLCEWVVVGMGFMMVRDRISAWTTVGIQPGLFAMLLGQAMLLWGVFATWVNRRIDDTKTR